MKYIIQIWKNRIRKFTDHPMAIFPFLKKRLYYYFIADDYIKFYKNTQFLNYNDTLISAIKDNRSIIRFGDELFDMLQGIGLYFNNWRQKYDKTLADALRNIITSKNKKILLCFNPELILSSKKEFEDKGIGAQWQFWINSKIFLKDYLQTGRVYGSALCFNPEYNKNIPYKLLKDYFATKDIIIVASQIDRFGHIKLGKTTTLISAPSSDAWERYPVLFHAIKDSIENNKLSKESVLILASISTAGKILVQDFSDLGYTAWDTGQFFDLAFKEITALDVKK